jgi:putative membrane protein
LSDSPSRSNGTAERPGAAFFCLLAAYGAAWGLTAIAPRDRGDWLLENLLVFAAWAALWRVLRRPGLSPASWALVFAFLTLHAYGAHHTYSNTPLGDVLQQLLGLERNHYDRIVHLSFGLLITLPVRELLARSFGIGRRSGSLLAATVVLSMSAVYEIFEWLAARIVDPELGVAFVGAQGDVWDAQKDMGLALSGVALALLASAARSRRGSAPSYTAGA